MTERVNAATAAAAPLGNYGSVRPEDGSYALAIVQSGEAQPPAQAPKATEATPLKPDAGVIALLERQIGVEKATIDALTKQLTNGVTDAREAAITAQIEAAQQRLTELQGRLDLTLAPQLPNIPQPPGLNQGPDGIPPDLLQRVENISYAFFLMIAVIAIGVPLARAFARWLDRRGSAPAPAAPQANLEPRLERIEQAVEAIAIEVERISEGQRFTNKLMSEARALPAPNPLDKWPAAAEKQELRAK